MKFGEGVFGKGRFGGPPPEEFEEQDEDEKIESYRELYEKMKELQNDLPEFGGKPNGGAGILGLIGYSAGSSVS